jgi:uroporphyrinogen-III decarboxylase
MFDPSKYRERMAEARRLYETTRQFREPERVPVRLSIAAPYYCQLFGYNMRDYYTNLDCQIDVQLKALEWAFEALQDDRTDYGIHLDIGIVGEAIYFGQEVFYPENAPPIGIRGVQTAEDVERLELTDPATHPGVQAVYRRYEELKERVARRGLSLPVSGGFPQIHPPLSAACALMEPQQVYELMYSDPELVHRFLAKMFIAFCWLKDYNDRYFGTRTTRLGLADDNSAFISLKMYREFVFPYNKALYERYGTEWRSFHADGPNDHLFAMYANEMKLNEMDIGGFSDIANAKRELGGKVVFSGGINNRDLYDGFEAGKPAIERAIRIGAPGGGYIFAIGGETSPGVPEDVLLKTVRYVKEIGRYPISL